MEKFEEFKQRMNDKIFKAKNLEINRFFALDNKAYADGKLSKKTKEMLGLAASMVLRCDDCISHHIIQSKKAGTTNEELFEVFSIALIVGGSIVIPHLRRAVDLLEDLNKK